MYFYDSIVTQLENLIKSKKITEERIAKLPKGRLIKRYSRGKIYYYVQNENKRISLYNNKALLDAHMQKKELELQLRSINQDIKVIEKIKSRYIPYTIIDYRWEEFIAEQNEYYAEEKKHLYGGTYYRTKSEYAIANALTVHGIEFKYEAGYNLGNKIIYPDFIIKHPKTGKIIIWEHFGYTCDKNYLAKVEKKICEYRECGITLWDTLLISFDTPEGSLDIDHIEKIVKVFLQ